MVYARKRRLRKTLRNNRNLSTRRIFNNKSAKAQASQIYALRKRLNRVYNRTKPEYKVLRTDLNENRFLGPETTNGPNTLKNEVIFRAIVPNLGTADDERIGNKITMFPLNFFLNVRYTHVNEIINTVYPYIQQPLNSNGLMLRFVAIQAISSGMPSPQISDIFEQDLTGTNALPQDLMMMLTMPFKNGITTKYKILKDKRITVNEDKPIYAARFKIKPQIKTLRFEEGVSIPAGQIYYILIAAGGDLRKVEDDNNVSRFNYNFIDCTWRYEMVYTDV